MSEEMKLLIAFIEAEGYKIEVVRTQEEPKGMFPPPIELSYKLIKKEKESYQPIEEGTEA